MTRITRRTAKPSPRAAAQKANFNRRERDATYIHLDKVLERNMGQSENIFTQSGKSSARARYTHRSDVLLHIERSFPRDSRSRHAHDSVSIGQRGMVRTSLGRPQTLPRTMASTSADLMV